MEQQFIRENQAFEQHFSGIGEFKAETPIQQEYLLHLLNRLLTELACTVFNLIIVQIWCIITEIQFLLGVALPLKIWKVFAGMVC